MDQACRVSCRLVTHRDPGAEINNHGITSAIAIRGIPRNVGLINCSKNPTDMISFKGLFLEPLRFEPLVLQGKYGLALWVA